MGWWTGGIQHWTVNDWEQDHSRCADQAKAIVDYLERTPGVGPYNFLICHHGGRFTGRGWDRQSGANGTSETNRTRLAAAYISRPGLPLTAAAKRAFRDLWAEADVLGEVDPHRTITGSECPGDEAIAWINAGMPVDDEEGELTVADIATLQGQIQKVWETLTKQVNARADQQTHAMWASHARTRALVLEEIKKSGVEIDDQAIIAALKQARDEEDRAALARATADELAARLEQ